MCNAFWKMTFRCACLALIAALFQAAALASDFSTTGAGGFPATIELKTPKQTFTHKFYFLLREGRIWAKSRTETGDDGRWQLLNGTGLPSPAADKAPWKNLTHIKAISADGDNLIAVSRQNIVYYTKTYNWKWKDHFSAIPFTRQLVMPSGSRAFGISHRGSFMRFYRDIDGNAHSVSAGVTSLYLLDADGHTIRYADPWLPPKFAHVLDTPEKGRFIAESMSVSGSTVFLMNAAGKMYTRLYDYDTSGQNPVLSYSYKRENRQETTREKTRSLPPEDWLLQPEIAGNITSLITIFQTGEGNSSFELRVEGTDEEGQTGYFAKPIYDGEWSFYKTGHPLVGTPIDRNAADEKLYAPPKTRSFLGKIRRDNLTVAAELLDFWPFSPPATIRFKAAGQVFAARLHMRKYHEKKNGRLAFAATVELPREFVESKDSECRSLFNRLFNNSQLIDMVMVSDNSMVCGAENLHLIGISELADNVVSLMSKNGPSGEIKAAFNKRLRFEFNSKKN